MIKETDLYIQATRNLRRRALKAILKYRTSLEEYIEHHPEFLYALKPFPVENNASLIVKEMAEAGKEAGVGPMASVAEAIAEYIGKELLPFSPELIIENGGDISLKTSKKRFVGVYAGNSPFSGKIALEIRPEEETPLGSCTSPGTLGHSLSFGRADACIVLSSSAALADAVATATGNIVKDESDIPEGIEFAKSIEGIKGVVIIKREKAGGLG